VSDATPESIRYIRIICGSVCKEIQTISERISVSSEKSCGQGILFVRNS
jgi:hypothetical protein